MEQIGKLFQVMQETGGEGKSGKWSKCDFVLDVEDAKYPKKIAITAWNKDVDTIKQTPVGSELKVSFDLSSREYNGKWYTDVKAWKIEVTKKAEATQTHGSPNYESDPLPF